MDILVNAMNNALTAINTIPEHLAGVREKHTKDADKSQLLAKQGVVVSVGLNAVNIHLSYVNHANEALKRSKLLPDLTHGLHVALENAKTLLDVNASRVDGESGPQVVRENDAIARALDNARKAAKEAADVVEAYLSAEGRLAYPPLWKGTKGEA